MLERIKESALYILNEIGESPKMAITLGSGLGEFTNRLEDKKIIPYERIPGFKKTTVAGHQGALIAGKIGNNQIVCLSGRYHGYEGHPQEEIVFPSRVMKFIGAKYLLLTNAAGGMNNDYRPGDLVMIKDHINLTGRNPLVGENIDELGPRFPDMSNTYNRDFRKIIRTAAETNGQKIKEGVYLGVLGPTYETPAEIRMFKTMGGDLVGMSTVAEAIAAHHCGLIVGGISCVTNMAAGINDEVLMHEDIKDQALQVMDKFSSLVEKIAESI
jgi:purine-nucleoside phosphorylase